MNEIEDHAYSQTAAEVGGVLMGTTSKSGTSIEGFIPALSATAEQVTLTFTHDVWEDILRMAGDQFPDLRIVGWYHTHPTFGIFLSEYDLFIQQNFFNDPGHFALVIDPVQGLYGWFANNPDGSVAEIEHGKTIRGPKRSVEPLTPQQSQGKPWKAWVFGGVGLVLGAGLGTGITLAQTPPDVSGALIESRQTVASQAEVVAGLEAELAALYEYLVLTHVPGARETLEDIARLYYRDESSGLSRLMSANGLLSPDEMVPGLLLVVPEPEKASVATKELREISWSALPQYNNGIRPPITPPTDSLEEPPTSDDEAVNDIAEVEPEPEQLDQDAIPSESDSDE